ncbi:hypothetical protein KU75_16895 [Pectobacterium odoriferum]|uniref:DUF2489 domain-containing protein n=1 Tax=Pectobacterium odoriferum TaxID=78398 RepID=A0ABR4VLZ4_9GAMM|nr:hypothetical protein [Pectobacterium odoriferum]KGA40412.1 hypothetical protein KU75_16895 [Pectobacterium odoriferum]
METTSIWVTPSTWFSFLTAIITICGWIITAKLAKTNISAQAKSNEINRLVEELYKNLDCIYNEMLSLIPEDADKKSAYYRFISLVKNTTFICQQINRLDSFQTVQFQLIGELRQSCTNDKKYDEKKIRITLLELQDIHERIKKSYIKKF